MQEYELKGVVATQDMQRAARRVAQENERLRTLLARHGILKGEVDSFLRSCERTEVSTEPETPLLLSRSSTASAADPHSVHLGPRSLHIHPLRQAHPKENIPYPSPISRQPVHIPRQSHQLHVSTTNSNPVHQHDATTQLRPTPCGVMEKPVDTPQVKATGTSNPGEAFRQPESYYASPTETQSPSPPRRQEGVPSRTNSSHVPTAVSQRQGGCCPPSNLPKEVVMEDLECPSTEDCFCPSIATVSPPTKTQRPGSDEISCEAAATIIAQMRGDGDNTTARIALGCGPGQECSIKNSFLMQVLDER